MDSKPYLLCSLCSYKTNQSSLFHFCQQKIIRTRWVICLECQHVQQKPPFQKMIHHVFKIISFEIKHFLHGKHPHNTAHIVPKLFHKSTCTRCHSHALLEWDGHCPKCGSAFLTKIA